MRARQVPLPGSATWSSFTRARDYQIGLGFRNRLAAGQTKALAIACGVSKLRPRHEESRFAGRTQILKPHTPRRAATPSALLHPDEACSRSKLAVGSTQTGLSAAQAGFAKYIIPNPVIASALALRAASVSSSAGAAS
jgi:hypothetical protein